MLKTLMPVSTEAEQPQTARPEVDERALARDQARPSSQVVRKLPPLAETAPVELVPEIQQPITPPLPRWDHGWPVPSSITSNPEEARASIQLPEFDELLL